jgi:hypothetical protein
VTRIGELGTSSAVTSNWLVLLNGIMKYEITGVHQCGFCHNRWTTDQIFCICQTLETKCEYNKTVHQLFLDFKKTYDSVRREVLYNILIWVWSSHEISQAH